MKVCLYFRILLCLSCCQQFVRIVISIAKLFETNSVCPSDTIFWTSLHKRNEPWICDFHHQKAVVTGLCAVYYCQGKLHDSLHKALLTHPLILFRKVSLLIKWHSIRLMKVLKHVTGEWLFLQWNLDSTSKCSSKLCQLTDVPSLEGFWANSKACDPLQGVPFLRILL